MIIIFQVVLVVSSMSYVACLKKMTPLFFYGVCVCIADVTSHLGFCFLAIGF